MFLTKTTLLLLLAVAFNSVSVAQQNEFRKVVSLDGKWQVSLDNEASWVPIEVPGTIEDQIDLDFDGISIYKRLIKAFPIEDRRRLFVHFDAVATEATIYFNGNEIGKHLGGWTPFRFEITELAKTDQKNSWEIKVVCDEKVGHNTQGFLPVFAPHFSGIWKGVKLVETDQQLLDDLRTAVFGDFEARTIDAHVSTIRGNSQKSISDLKHTFSIRRLKDKEWYPVEELKLVSSRERSNGQVDLEYQINLSEQSDSINLEPWTTSKPTLFDLKIELHELADTGEMVKCDETIARLGFRDVRTENEKLLLNGRPLIVRGLLNWGYAPPKVAPSLDENFMRREIEFAKNRGFNLMKFCLWVPPKRYLELCDEMGMLAWMEYPSWHPKFNQETKQELLNEYDEFYHYDRIHPSVVLRSLTCETGPSADLDVIQSLYDLCKKRIPGAVVEDDSSWIGWNRIHDFYDDHPYGNNHTWNETLERLKNHIAEREAKPLILGEAIAADTWTDPAAILSASKSSDEHWHPNFLHDSQSWFVEWQRRHDRDLTSKQLFADSKKYGMLMRKFQIEKYRQKFPYGGYVVSVIRDIPLCAMGLIDYLDQPKHSADDWAWHHDVMLTLQTENDKRLFIDGRPVDFKIIVHCPESDSYDRDNLKLVLKSELLVQQFEKVRFDENDINSVPVTGLFTEDIEPYDRIAAELIDRSTGRRISSNSWPIWTTRAIQEDLDDWPVWKELPSSRIRVIDEIPEDESNRFDFVRTNSLTLDHVDYMKKGGNVVMFASHTESNVRTKEHWFLRGGPLVGDVEKLQLPREFFIELQHFDLTSKVIPDLHEFENCDHLLAVWDNHDLSEVRVHGIISRFPVGPAGNLVVIALQREQCELFLKDLLDRSWMRSLDVGNKNLDLISDALSRHLHALTQKWSFSDQLSEDWDQPDFQLTEDWKTISINQHWDSQGFAALDGWGYYRVQLKVDDNWNCDQTFLNFTGVDDYYEVFANGEFVGKGGDMENRITAFDAQASHNISEFVKRGQTLTIAVKVYDWQGAGGIFRPVSITNQPFSDQPKLFK